MTVCRRALKCLRRDPDNDPEEDALEAGDDGSDLEPLEMDLPENLAGEASEDSASA